MFQAQTLVTVADNTGAKIGRVFKILGGSKRRYARIGDVVVFSVQTAEPRKLVKKKEVLRGLVVRQRAPYRRKDGSYLRFDENAVVVIDDKGEPRGGRIFGPIPREISEIAAKGRDGYKKIVSLAPEVV